MGNSTGNIAGGDCPSEKRTLASRVSAVDITKSV